MGRAPCCDKLGLKKGPWTPEEDKILIDHIQSNGHGSWRSLPKLAGLLRCGKSCRLRWTNYLRPDIKRGPFTPEEQKSIIQLHGIVGNKWSTIAAHLPGRTDNEIKNYWNTHLKKRLVRMGINPDTYAPDSSPSSAGGGGGGGGVTASSSAAAPSASATRHMAQWESARLEAEARLSRESYLFSSSGAAVATPSGKAELSSINQEAPDFFLRIWNSEVGESFRTRENVSSSSPASSSNKHGSSAVTVATAEAARDGGTGSSDYSQRKEDVECKSCLSIGGADSSSSNEVEDTSEETYRMYMDLVGDEMGCLLHGTLSGFSLFSTDLNEASLDTAFK